jgi:hypothetical protein
MSSGIAYPAPTYIPPLSVFNPLFFPQSFGTTTTSGGGGGGQTNIFPNGLTSGNVITMDGGTGGGGGTGVERTITGLSQIEWVDITDTNPTAITGYMVLNGNTLEIGSNAVSSGINVNLLGSVVSANGVAIATGGNVSNDINNTFVSPATIQTFDTQSVVMDNSQLSFSNGGGITLNGGSSSNIIFPSVLPTTSTGLLGGLGIIWNQQGGGGQGETDLICYGQQAGGSNISGLNIYNCNNTTAPILVASFNASSSTIYTNPTIPTSTTIGTLGSSNTATTYWVNNLYAPIANPALTGTPTAPTATGGTNTTQIATTQFVQSAVSGGISGVATQGGSNNFTNTNTFNATTYYKSATSGTDYFTCAVGFEIGTGANILTWNVGNNPLDFYTFNTYNGVALQIQNGGFFTPSAVMTTAQVNTDLTFGDSSVQSTGFTTALKNRLAPIFDNTTSTNLSISTGLTITNPVNSYFVSVAQGGLDTNNPQGITINPAPTYTTACNFGGNINMNSNDITNLNSISSATGNPMTLSSDDILYLNSGNNTQINALSSFTATAGDNVILTATNDAMTLSADDDITLTSVSKGVLINGGTGDAGVNDITLTTQNSTLVGNIVLNSGGDIQLTTDQYTNITTGKAITITSITDKIELFSAGELNLNAPNEINITTPIDIWFNQNAPNSGDGNVYGNFNGNLNGTASNATNVDITDNNTSATYYPTFVSNNTGNLPLNVDKTTNPLSYIPSTGNLTSTLFTGNLTGTATNATNCFTQFTSTSASYYPVFTSSNSTGYYSQNVGTMTYNPSTNSLTANTFNGNATKLNTTSDNSATTSYILFSQGTAGSGKTIYQDDTTTPLSYTPSTSTLSATNFSGLLDTGGLVYLSTGSQAITGSASATNINLTGIFNSTYKNYRIVLYPTTQVSFTAYPNYSLTAFLGSGTLPTTASLYGFEITSASSAVVSPVYTASATISSVPLVLAVSQLVNHQTIIEVENVGYSATATQSIGLKCKSFYNNPGITGASDRSISAVNVSGSTITGLTLQQSAITSGTMTIGWTIYGYK